MTNNIANKNKLVSELISKVLREYIFEGEDSGNPFAAAADSGKEEPTADEPAAEEPAADEEKAPAEDDKKPKEKKEDDGLSFNFDVSGVKKYNTNSFRNSTAVAKKITKNGILATVQPDGVDILVGFDDITEIANAFFKVKK
jgi:ribosomal protein L12E/L44/L45/RPP1/RPP2